MGLELETKIKNVGWSLGSYCNARCKHCYSWRQRQSKLDLTKEEIDIIISKLKRLEVETLNLGGNEPIFTSGADIKKTLLPYIIEQTTSSGIKIGITTNGITAVYLHRHFPDIFRLVNDWDVSFDSPFKIEHDANRGTNIYDLAVKSLDVCTEEKVPKAIITCLMNWNSDIYHLSAFLQLAKEHRAEFRINTLRPTDPWHYSMLPTVEQFYKSFNYLLNETEQIVIGEPILAALCDVESDGCPCGTHSMRITSKSISGKVPITPCVYLYSHKVGNILEDNLSELVNSYHFEEIRHRREEIPKLCHELDCEYLEKCRGGCAARALLITGDINNPDPYCPQLAERSSYKIPEFPQVKAGHEGIRVHENYLCTWIGKPKEQ